MKKTLQLKNYPSGDPEFDKWFQETQPDWAKEIDLKIAREKMFQDTVNILEEICDVISIDHRLYNLIGPELYKKARKLTILAKGELK